MKTATPPPEWRAGCAPEHRCQSVRGRVWAFYAVIYSKSLETWSLITPGGDDISKARLGL